jgi:hypothetical protein
MSASYATTAAPPNALRIWCDTRYIYVELPTKPSAPACVLTYPRTGKGFGDLLSLLYGSADNSGSMPANWQPARKITPQSALAESILRRQGILK